LAPSSARAVTAAIDALDTEHCGSASTARASASAPITASVNARAAPFARARVRRAPRRPRGMDSLASDARARARALARPRAPPARAAPSDDIALRLAHARETTDRGRRRASRFTVALQTVDDASSERDDDEDDDEDDEDARARATEARRNARRRRDDCAARTRA
jgi:hypothetical protein